MISRRKRSAISAFMACPGDITFSASSRSEIAFANPIEVPHPALVEQTDHLVIADRVAGLEAQASESSIAAHFFTKSEDVGG